MQTYHVEAEIIMQAEDEEDAAQRAWSDLEDILSGDNTWMGVIVRRVEAH